VLHEVETHQQNDWPQSSSLWSWFNKFVIHQELLSIISDLLLRRSLQVRLVPQSTPKMNLWDSGGVLYQQQCIQADNPRDTFTDQSRSTNMGPFHMLHMVSYYCAIVTLSIRHTVFEIFDFKNAVTLKTGLGVCEGHCIRYRAYDFLLTFYSNYGSISCCFWDIQCRKILQPANPS